ncbi:hypothetical protein LCM17_06645 [Cereibacter sphaeroides]|nr:hypothetical protein [Cereibacter sphaeroides]
MTFFLHIGSHKTGTTSIQYSAKRHLAEDVRYLDIRRPETKLATTSGRGRRFAGTLRLERAEALFADAAARGEGHDGHLLASDEDLFWVNDPDVVARLADLARRHFGEVRVVCYLRRQDRLTLAHRKQVIEGHAAARFYAFGTDPLPLPRDYYRDYLDFHRKLNRLWLPAFGRENILVRNAQRSALIDGDVLADFTAVTGIRFDNPGRVEANSSLGGNQVFLGLFLAQEGKAPKIRRQLVRKVVPEGKFLPSRSEAQAFLSSFAASNERLAHRWNQGLHGFQPFDEDFEDYPEVRTEAAWRYDDVAENLRRHLGEEELRRLGLEAGLS